MLKWLDKRENDRTHWAEYHIILKTILEGKRGFSKGTLGQGDGSLKK